MQKGDRCHRQIRIFLSQISGKLKSGMRVFDTTVLERHIGNNTEHILAI